MKKANYQYALKSQFPTHSSSQRQMARRSGSVPMFEGSVPLANSRQTEEAVLLAHTGLRLLRRRSEEWLRVSFGDRSPQGDHPDEEGGGPGGGEVPGE